MRVLVWATAITAAVGCEPTFRECAVHCGTNDLCPTDTTCGTDGFCHTPATVNQACSVLPPDGVGPGPDALERCTPPLLLVAIQDLGSGHGRVERFSIGADAVTRCSGDLSGKGTLGADLMALTWVPPASVAVVTQSQVHLIEIQTDRVLWSMPVASAGNALPVAATVLGSGTLVIGSDSRQNSTDDVRFLDRYQIADGHLDGSSTLAFEPERMTRDPTDATKILTLQTGMFAAAETDPITGTRVSPPFADDVPNANLETISALFETPVFIAWAGTPSGARDGVYYIRDGLTNVAGPVRCDAATRTYADVVPDPDRAHFRFFAITDSATGREVVHFASTGGPCDAIVVGSMLGTTSRISALAVVDL